ncbi:MAG TPA: MarR family transcriptional regulator [Steroidobacteraceae bacterium]|jgi:MarR family transcriptional regulator for hemolysin|nr:MarR family transcriptional regulator [Steroidobacteraceae bacterium]
MVSRAGSVRAFAGASRTSRTRGTRVARGTRGSTAPAPLQAHLESDELLEEYKRHYRVGSEIDLQLRLTRGFTMVARRWRKYLDERLRRIGQSQARWEALFAVAMSRDGSALGAIAKRVGVEGPTFVRMIAQFEREGLVKRLASSEDRRASIIRITPKGEQVLTQMRELTTKVRKEFLGELSVDDVRKMLDMLEHMLSFLKD